MQVAKAAGWLQIGRIGVVAVEIGAQRQALDDERSVGEVLLNQFEVIFPQIRIRPIVVIVVIRIESQLPDMLTVNCDVKLFEACRFRCDLLSKMNHFEKGLAFF